MPMSMTDEELISRALELWANWIETKDPVMSRNDIQAAGDKDKIQKLPQLTNDQIALVTRMRKLAIRVKL